MTLLTNQQVGDFVIIGEIDRGAFGKVYKARDMRLYRLVAIKELASMLGSGAADERAARRKRFEHEIEMLSRFSHPNVVAAYQIVSQNSEDYLVMEYVDGGSLKKQLAGGAISVERAMAVTIDICRALSEISRYGIVHRDIKPANILLTSGGQAKLTDFGVALQTAGNRPQQTTTSSKVVGTRLYMSPEQEKSTPTLDHRSDLYSLGLVLFEMLTGCKYKESNAADRKMGRRVPRSISAVVNKAMRLDPARRYQTAAEFEVALQRALVVSRKPSRLISRATIGAGGLMLMTAVGIALLLFSTGSKISEPVVTVAVLPTANVSTLAVSRTAETPVSDRWVYDMLEIITSSQTRFGSEQDVRLAWLPPQSIIQLPSNQVYRVWIIYTDVSGQQQKKDFSTSSPELVLSRDEFFINGRSVAADGVYQWAIEVVDTTGGVLQAVSPQTYPLFQFSWDMAVATPAPMFIPPVMAIPPSGDPTPVCKSGQVWNEVMNRCQPDPNNQKSPPLPPGSD